MNDKNIFPILIHAILAFWGGCVREVGNVDKIGFYIFKFISGAFVSTFGGVVTYFLCMNYDMNPWLTAALTSLAGYIGIPLLDAFVMAIKKKAETYIAFSDEEKE